MQKATKTMITLVIELNYCPEEDTLKFFIDDAFDKLLHKNESVQIVSIDHLYEELPLK
jgi:hypothetical protein